VFLSVLFPSRIEVFRWAILRNHGHADSDGPTGVDWRRHPRQLSVVVSLKKEREVDQSLVARIIKARAIHL